MYDSMPSHMDTEQAQPISRTYQYRKVMKPMLERKRRARINRCLDELKELMVCALQAEGENVSKLEKADILELTVRHLHKLKKERRLNLQDSDRFRAGFTQCAHEVSKCLAAIPGVDIQLGTKLMTHLGHRLNDIDRMSPLEVRVPESSVSGESSPELSPGSPIHYGMPLTPASSRGGSESPDPEFPGLLKLADTTPTAKSCAEAVWRPW